MKTKREVPQPTFYEVFRARPISPINLPQNVSSGGFPAGIARLIRRTGSPDEFAATIPRRTRMDGNGDGDGMGWDGMPLYVEPICRQAQPLKI